MWPAASLSALDQYFMSFRGHHAAFVVAVVVLVGSSVALGVLGLGPMEGIRKRVGPAFFSTDMSFGYRPAELYAMLDRYEGDDYKAHRLFIFLDLVYPLLYSVSLAVMLGYLLPHLAPAEHTRIHYLTLLPLAAALFDVLENLSMLFILCLREGGGPAAGRSDALAQFSSAMTMVKLVLAYASLLLTVVGILLTLLAAAASRKRPAAPAS